MRLVVVKTPMARWRTWWWGCSADPVLDDFGPEIQLYINDSLFRAGDVVHEDPWLFARIFDESGINTSGLGIGHDAKAVLDGETAAPLC